jgi:hypothetical protein
MLCPAEDRGVEGQEGAAMSRSKRSKHLRKLQRLLKGRVVSAEIEQDMVLVVGDVRLKAKKIVTGTVRRLEVG